LIKLILDYPISYVYVAQGDATFCLPQYYKESEFYRTTIKELQKNGREIMLDNGAWEFGRSMHPLEFLEVVKELKPTWAVIPDVMKDAAETEKYATTFLTALALKPIPETKFMFAPQGKNIKELVTCYNNIVSRFYTLIDMLAIPKHVGKIINRVKFTDHLWEKAIIKFQNVHFLGFHSMKELEFTAEQRNWNLFSIDTKFPIKKSFGFGFKNEDDYYRTTRPLGVMQLEQSVAIFQRSLGDTGW